MDINKITELLHKLPFDPSNRPDPMETSFAQLEARVQDVINGLWQSRDRWQQRASDLHPIWRVSLRMTAMYLNMSDAFHGCGADFMREVSAGETKFVAKYQDCEAHTGLERACCLLARTVKMLRLLGFTSPVVAIGGDAHYHRMCEETIGLLAALKRA